MDLSVTYEYKSEPGGVQVAWFEDCDALVEYQLTWVPGSLSLPARICAFPGPEVPARVDPVDLLIEMDTALTKGGYR